MDDYPIYMCGSGTHIRGATPIAVMRVPLSDRIGRIQYAIRKYTPLARRLQEEGEEILYLNIGDPLKYDYETPSFLVEEACRAVRENHSYYAPSPGVWELRRAIAEKERSWNGNTVDPHLVIVTQGVSEAINLLYMSLLDPGDKVLLPDPTYPLYIALTPVYGAEPIYYSMREEEGWQPDPDDIRRGLEAGAKLLVVNNPNNPTGALYPPRLLREILDIAAEYGVPVASDEIYDALVYEGEFRSLASLASEDQLVVGLNGFSKTYLVPGWRIGYIYVAGPREEAEELYGALLRGAQARLSAPAPLQVALARALSRPPSHLEELRRRLDERRRYLVEKIEETPGLELSAPPRAAFYALPRLTVPVDDEEFTRRLLLEEKVLVVHGSGFGPAGRGHVRLVFLPPPGILDEAFRRIGGFVGRLQGGSAF